MARHTKPGEQQKNDAYRRELDLNMSQAEALVACVTSYLVDGCPGVCRRWVDRLVAENGGHSNAGEELLPLFRRGMLVEVAQIENEIYYRPTNRTIDKVKGWAGWHERGTEAAE